MLSEDESVDEELVPDLSDEERIAAGIRNALEFGCGRRLDFAVRPSATASRSRGVVDVGTVPPGYYPP
ncbi:hypothetical protein HTZ84_06045 [Haloterrigena sp. SYSU A558-1]|uniref:Uncharacterized protein n=1 Tax=Haloterrigena gelatinilytica TaxID=2741724 RepID=A0ABX2L6H6_9EURY|nr:hypothetical protein [Haloterrigena gelatinilytica]NUC71877.1 hypothetical protein [Haloterrigena gelatinilytica]